ncbi:DM13 domain-containing protein [Jiella marina]|uniref:DM13 domain-containing protein n=1 Tax=Jiella sp. LLJ827 TaxID=2917712 RepID=UPI00210187FC|nr:DM13 domain-containing protein [Jiella sp. LLJ827]MCQ0987372.1 DM13 domain-containing protein [Jiella sp. LLJ827]
MTGSRLRLHAATLTAALFALAPGAMAETLKEGRFSGASGHSVSGLVTVETDGGETILRFSEDFSFDGAPDPKIAFGKDGYDAETLLGPLKSDSGAQQYAVPAGLDVSAYNEVWIWCEEFAVPLGMASIE